MCFGFSAASRDKHRRLEAAIDVLERRLELGREAQLRIWKRSRRAGILPNNEPRDENSAIYASYCLSRIEAVRGRFGCDVIVEDFSPWERLC